MKTKTTTGVDVPRSVRGIPQETWNRWTAAAEQNGETIGDYIVRRVDRESTATNTADAVKHLRLALEKIEKLA